MRKIRVLIVDDSALAQRMIVEALANDPEIEVVGIAANGRRALEEIARIEPDLVTLDVEMPEMDGIQTMSAIRESRPALPVIMLSAHTERGAVVTIEALATGAADYVTKPAGSPNWQATVNQVREQLVAKIKALCPAAPRSPSLAAPDESKSPSAIRAARVDVVAIGASTGGPNAIERLLSALPADFAVPVVVVQHMPPMFTRYLAERLATRSPLAVREAVARDILLPATVWIAPGDFHMELDRAGASICIRLHQAPPVNSCRPSVDVLFRSAAKFYDSHTLAVVLTGMGNDGLAGCREILAAGGQVLAQDESTSVVWGMPGSVVHAGLADKVLPAERLAPEIVRRVRIGRDPSAKSQPHLEPLT